MFNHPLKVRNDLIPGYRMNESGSIYSDHSQKVLLPFHNKEGRPTIALTIYGKKKAIRLDYLVISTFNKYRDDMIRIVHLDDNDKNCDPNNLMVVRIIDIIDKYKKMYNVENLEDISEEWKPYPGLKDIEVSNFGSVRYISTKNPISPRDTHGYKWFFIGRNHYLVHRLVAELFVENPRPDKFTYVNHLDGVKSHNMFWNLEWCNLSFNGDHAYLTGLTKRYDDKSIEDVCKLLSDGVPHNIISMITGVPRKHISDIYRGRRRKDISSKYEFKSRLPLSEIYHEDLVKILIKDGYKPKEISELLKIDYNQSFISYYERLKRAG